MHVSYFMGWQEISVFLIVAGTAGAFLYQRLRRRKSALSRTPPCCCPSAEQAAKGPSIVYRARKGERPEVVVKFK